MADQTHFQADFQEDMQPLSELLSEPLVKAPLEPPSQPLLPAPFPRVTAKAIRLLILEQSKRAHVGHIGSALSVADILAVLFSGRLESGNPDGENPEARDRFVLSKGHAALALYCSLFLQGKLDQAALDTYCGDGSRLGVHPEKELPGIDFSSGSLGQGLGTGAGAALAMKLKGSFGRVRVLISDAELNEGSTWEAIMFAAHHKLDNLDVIIDLNGQQALGMTHDVINLTPMAGRWSAFGWHVRHADGHDAQALHRELASMAETRGKPQVLLAETRSGKGVSFMESRIKWHYFPMTDVEYAAARREVEAA